MVATLSLLVESYNGSPLWARCSRATSTRPSCLRRRPGPSSPRPSHHPLTPRHCCRVSSSVGPSLTLGPLWTQLRLSKANSSLSDGWSTDGHMPAAQCCLWWERVFIFWLASLLHTFCISLHVGVIFGIAYFFCLATTTPAYCKSRLSIYQHRRNVLIWLLNYCHSCWLFKLCLTTLLI
jgi:hypothetical protein